MRIYECDDGLSYEAVSGPPPRTRWDLALSGSLLVFRFAPYVRHARLCRAYLRSTPPASALKLEGSAVAVAVETCCYVQLSTRSSIRSIRRVSTLRRQPTLHLYPPVYGYPSHAQQNERQHPPRGRSMSRRKTATTASRPTLSTLRGWPVSSIDAQLCTPITYP